MLNAQYYEEEVKRGGGRAFIDDKRGGARAFLTESKRGGARAFQVGYAKLWARGLVRAALTQTTNYNYASSAIAGIALLDYKLQFHMQRKSDNAIVEVSNDPRLLYLFQMGLDSEEKRGGARAFQLKRGGARAFQMKRGGARAFLENKRDEDWVIQPYADEERLGVF